MTVKLTASVSNLRIYPKNLEIIKRLLEPTGLDLSEYELILDNKRVVGYIFKEPQFEPVLSLLELLVPKVTFSNEEYEQRTYQVEGLDVNFVLFAHSKNPYCVIQFEDAYAGS